MRLFMQRYGLLAIYLTFLPFASPFCTWKHDGSSSRLPTFLFSSSSVVDLRSNQQVLIASGRVQIYSLDPLVYVIPDLLSPEECDAYQQRVEELESARPLTRSNPPDVSIDIKKLYPLPFLSLLAGLPPYLHLLSEETDLSVSAIITAVLPNVALALAGGIFLAFGLVLPLIKNVSDTSARTSVAVAFNQLDDIDFIRNLVDRASDTIGHPWTQWEAPVVTRYDPGAIFSRHGDASPTRGSEWVNEGGQRVVTCICYLNNVESGGETYFDKLKIAVQPKKGQALVFFPADSTTLDADDRTTHESLSSQGEKWIVQLFGRANRVPPPLGIPDEYM